MLLFGKTSKNLVIDSFTALNVAYKVYHNNDIAINSAKTKQLKFGNKLNEMDWAPDVEGEEYTTFLGITIDEKLLWNEHIDNLSCNPNTNLYVLWRIKFKVTK